jgi:hypothetical protein
VEEEAMAGGKKDASLGVVVREVKKGFEVNAKRRGLPM